MATCGVGCWWRDGASEGSAKVRDLVQDDPEDASLCGFAGISEAVASEVPKQGAWLSVICAMLEVVLHSTFVECQISF